MPGERIEQRPRLRGEQLPAATTLVVRGGRDTPDKLRSHAQRLHRADDAEVTRLLAALGVARQNPQYGRSAIWREEG